MERRSFEEELAEFKLELNQANFECDRAKADRDRAEQERDAAIAAASDRDEWKTGAESWESEAVRKHARAERLAGAVRGMLDLVTYIDHHHNSAYGRCQEARAADAALAEVPELASCPECKRLRVVLEKLVDACVEVTQEGWSSCIICDGDDVASAAGGHYAGAVAHEEGCAVKEAIVVILTPDFALVCAACGQPAQGQFSIHRDGFCDGPEVPICDACGRANGPSCEVLWEAIAARREVSK